MKEKVIIMTDIEKEFGFDLSKSDWSKCSNKACTHGYSKTMNQPRYKQPSLTGDLRFSGTEKKTSLSLEAMDFDLDSTMESVAADLAD